MLEASGVDRYPLRRLGGRAPLPWVQPVPFWMLPTYRPSISPSRVMTVTGGLLLAGGIVGGLVGGGLLGIFATIARITGAETGLPPLRVFGIAAGAGAIIGAVTGPPLAWLLLRRVPIGKALLHTAVGSVIGGLLGGVLTFTGITGRNAFPWFFATVFAGYVGAALRLWLISRRAPRSRLAAGHEGSDLGG